MDELQRAIERGREAHHSAVAWDRWLDRMDPAQVLRWLVELERRRAADHPEREVVVSVAAVEGNVMDEARRMIRHAERELERYRSMDRPDRVSVRRRTWWQAALLRLIPSKER